MTKSLWFRLPVIILTTTALLIVLFQRGYVRIQYPSHADFPVRGVDVSHHQDDIDWSVLTTDGELQFAFIKASEGTDFQDRRFDENWREAQGQVARSAYHFFTFCTPGEAQAHNFLQTAPDPGELPRAVDTLIDLNVFVGSRRSFEALLSGS